jgi:hypothetical protein
VNDGPTISQREYELLMQSNAATTSAVQATHTAISALTERIAEKYITRDEDDRLDQRVKDDIYAYVREQISSVYRSGDDIHTALQTQVRVCFGLISTQLLILVAMGGWIATHLGA